MQPDGAPVQRLPEGVVLHPLTTHTDDRGTVCELYDPSGRSTATRSSSPTCSRCAGRREGLGVHREHEDRYAFIAGEAEIVLYDEREDSPTFGLETRLFLSGVHRTVLVIPRGVWHAERNIGASDVLVVNFRRSRTTTATPTSTGSRSTPTSSPCSSARSGEAGSCPAPMLDA